jgi:hypothetical protein
MIERANARLRFSLAGGAQVTESLGRQHDRDLQIRIGRRRRLENERVVWNFSLFLHAYAS